MDTPPLAQSAFFLARIGLEWACFISIFWYELAYHVLACLLQIILDKEELVVGGEYFGAT